MVQKNNYQKYSFLLIVLAVFVITGFRWYKTIYSGVIYDEAMSYMRYTADVNTALTSYDPDNPSSTNNHILNSIMMHYARSWCPKLECHIRLFSFIAGTIFTFALAYLVSVAFRSKVLGCASYLLICFIPFVFDYSYLARGYAFALCGIFAYLAIVAFIIDHPVSFKVYWIFLVLLVLCNVVALGAMLSAVVAVASINVIFIFLYSAKAVSTRLKPMLVIGINAVVLAVGSGGSLFILYRDILPKLSGSKALEEIAKKWHGWSSFTKYMYQLLVEKSFAFETGIGKSVFTILALAAIVSLVYLAIRLKVKIKDRSIISFIDSPRGYMIVNLLGVTVFMLIYSIILGKSLGLIRNQVFYIPLALAVVFMVVDIAVSYLPDNVKRKMAIGLLSLVMMLSLFNNRPSMYLFEYNVSGPVIRKLKQIDPEKVWTIAFSEKMKMTYMGCNYYYQFGYKFMMAPGGQSLPEPGPFDVFICEKQELSPKTEGLGKVDNNIYSANNIAVLLNTPPEEIRIKLREGLMKYYGMRSSKR